MIKKLIAFVMAVAVFAGLGFTAFADTTATSSASVQAYIAALQNLRQLRQGMSGDDVKLLQATLATDPTIYPEGLISGRFGPLTSKAVAKFQRKYGLDAVGSVGPKTLKKLREVLGENDNSSENQDEGKDQKGKPCATIPPGHLIAPGFLKHHTATSTIAVPPCQKLPRGIEDRMGTTTVGALSIVSITPSNITASAAQIGWTTNQYATTNVWYGTSTPVLGASTTLKAATNGYDLAHLQVLTNLSTSTLYYYVVASTNLFGATATSSQSSFTTLAQ